MLPLFVIVENKNGTQKDRGSSLKGVKIFTFLLMIKGSLINS